MGKYILPRTIALHMAGGIILAAMIVVGSLFWMSVQQNKQASSATLTMVAGGIEALEEQIRTTTSDYAWWQDALDGVSAGDDQWIYSNMGSGVTETGTADIMAIVAPDLSVLYAWDNESGETSNPVLVPKPIVDRMAGLLADLPVTTVVARQAIARINGQYALLAVARISPDDVEALGEDARLPILIMGYYLTPERMLGIGRNFLIDDLAISDVSVPDDKSQLPLRGIAGATIGYLNWTPHLPGKSIFAKVMLPVGIALAVFSLIAFAATANARRLARSLADSEEEASRSARIDSLSNLPNRLSLTEEIARPETGRAAAAGRMAVIYVDINGFKNVNDTIGHAGGDTMIRQISQRLRSVVPDGMFLARVGGDEFNVVLTDLDEPETALNLANQIITTISPSYTVDDLQFHVTASVGYAISAQGQWSPLEVVRHADVAMYHAKKSGALEPAIYDPALESGAFQNKQIEEALRRGVENDEIRVVYQPIRRSGEEEIDSVEALVRWTSEDLGPISPATFIPIAEETGLITEIGRLVMRRACDDLARLPGVKLNINISPVQLRDPMFIENMKAIAEIFEIEPMRIEFELTEGIIVDHPELACNKLNMLKDAGFNLALDDFGTGFSSIGYLRRFPFDRLKIDRSFTAELGKTSKANGLMQSLITLGDALDLPVVAEGIETAEQANLLTLLGCGYQQGFYYARPMPIEEFPAILGGGEPMKLYSVSPGS